MEDPTDAAKSPEESAQESDSRVWLWVVGILAVVVVLGGVWFFAGPGSQVAAPAVVGLSQEDAEAEIIGAGLTVGKVGEEPTLEVEPGTVIEQTPEPGTEVAEGSAVDLMVAAIPMVEVPDVVGDSQEEATTKLAQEGLRLDDVEYVYDAKVDAGFVMAQAPEQGEEVTVGSTVVLTVSKGEESGKVPNVVGLSQDDAEAALSAAGFESSAKKAQDPDVPAGDVIKQSPAAGTSVATGSSVTLTVSTGAPAEPEAEEPAEPEAEKPEAEEPEKPEAEEPEKPEAPEAKAVVPDVVGMGIVEAFLEIRGAQLKIAIAWAPDDDNVLKVSTQDPSAGVEVDRGTTVTLSIGLPEFLFGGVAQPAPEQLPAPEPESTETTSP